MSICDSCLYGFGYPRPTPPENGFDSDVIGKRTGLAKFFFGENIYRGTYHDWDHDRFDYDYRMNAHENKIWCEALSVPKCVDKHRVCSLYKNKD